MVVFGDLLVDLFAARFANIKKALENSGRKFDLIINCNDDWLVYENDRINEKGKRIRELLSTRCVIGLPCCPYA